MDLNDEELLAKCLSDAVSIRSAPVVTVRSPAESQSSDREKPDKTSGGDLSVNENGEKDTFTSQKINDTSHLPLTSESLLPETEKDDFDQDDKAFQKCSEVDVFFDCEELDSSNIAGTASYETEPSEPVRKNRGVDIRSLSVITIPLTEGHAVTPSVFSATPGSSKDNRDLPANATLLIAGITVCRNDQLVPLLVVHCVISFKQKQKKRKLSKKTSIPPADYPIEEFFELPPEPTSLDDPLYSAPWEAPVVNLNHEESADFSATLHYTQSFALNDFSVSSDSGGQPEIQQIVPLAGGRLLAVSCCMFPVSRGLFGGEKEGREEPLQESLSMSGGLFLFRVEGTSLNFLQSTQTSDPSKISISLCPIEELSATTLQQEKYSTSIDTEKSTLLVSLLKSGELILYDCSKSLLAPILISDPSTPTPLVTFDPTCGQPTSAAVEPRYDSSSVSSSSRAGEFVDCVYCPATSHLALATREGRLLMLKLNHLEKSSTKALRNGVSSRSERLSVSDEESFKHSEFLALCEFLS